MGTVEYETFKAGARKKTDDREGQASVGTPSKRRKISSSETSPISVAAKITRKYKRMRHTSSPLSATAHRLVLKDVGEPGPGSVDNGSTQFDSILELARRENPELNIDYNLEERWIVVSR